MYVLPSTLLKYMSRFFFYLSSGGIFGLVKSNFTLSKYMLWGFKQIIFIRHYFEHPKQMLKLLHKDKFIIHHMTSQMGVK